MGALEASAYPGALMLLMSWVCPRVNLLICLAECDQDQGASC